MHIEVGSYSTSNYTYKLFYEGDKEFDLPLKFTVLNHFYRNGITKADWSKCFFPSDVTVRFFSNNEDIFNWFNGSGKRSFVIEIWKNNVLKFKGFYLPNPQYSSYNSSSNFYDLKFHDGIELLTDSINSISGFTTIDSFLRTALDAIGYALPISIIINLTASGILTKDYSPSSMRSSFQSVLDQTPNASLYDLLSAFLKVTKAFIYQEDGKWNIKEHANRGSNLLYEIAVNGSISQSNPTRESSSITLLRGSKRKTLRGIKTITRLAKNNNQSALILNPDFSNWNEDYTELEDWELEDGSIIPPFQFEDFNGVIFTDVDTKLYQKRTRILTGYGLPEFKFEGNVYIDGAVGTYDIAIAELIVYIRDTSDRESGFTKYWVHEPSISTELSPTQEFIFAEVEIQSGHSFNVPVDFSKIIDLPLTLYKDFYYEIRLLDQNEAVLTSNNNRRREYNLAELILPKSLKEAPEEDIVSVNSVNQLGASIQEEVYFTDRLNSLRGIDFQILDENDEWQDAIEWKYRSESDIDAARLNHKVLDTFLETHSDDKLFIKIRILKSDTIKINTELQAKEKSFDVFFIQEQAKDKYLTVYAIEQS